MSKITNKNLYWGLIITFAILYLFIGFVSTLHSITFFNLTNTLTLSILLGIAYEIGQASVLFSILMTKNKDKFLPWALMILLTALQISANVYASFKYMVNSGSDDWIYWQKSILIGVQAQNTEMYQVIISWIAGALLPVVALGMTALVAQNIRLMTEGEGDIIELPPEDKYNNTSDDISEKIKKSIEKIMPSKKSTTQEKPENESDNQYISNKKPIKVVRGWHLQKRYVDENGDIYNFGKFTGENILTTDKKSKKDEELLLTGDIKVPKNINDDISKEETKSDPFKNIEKLFKPSRGDEVIELLRKQSKVKDKDSITSSKISDQESSNDHLIPPEILTPYIDGGVEVIDAKAVPSKNPDNVNK